MREFSLVLSLDLGTKRFGPASRLEFSSRLRFGGQNFGLRRSHGQNIGLSFGLEGFVSFKSLQTTLADSSEMQYASAMAAA